MARRKYDPNRNPFDPALNGKQLQTLSAGGYTASRASKRKKALREAAMRRARRMGLS